MLSLPFRLPFRLPFHLPLRFELTTLGTELARYGKTAAMAATALTGDSLYFLLTYLLRFLRVAVLLAIWRAVLSGRGPEAGMSLDSTLTYTLVGAVFGSQLTARTELDDLLWSGAITSRFLRPMNLVGQLLAQMAGAWLFGFVFFSLPLLAAAPLLGVNPLPASASAAALFCLSLALAIAVAVALDFIVAALMVTYGWNRWDVERLRGTISALLSGAVIPLALLPWHLDTVLEWLPFASMAWAPLSIYSGARAGGDALRLLALQAAWAVALTLVARWLWRANRQKVVIYGG
jgi:ABC-type uncharacterized transport system permease subunit